MKVKGVSWGKNFALVGGTITEGEGWRKVKGGGVTCGLWVTSTRQPRGSVVS